MNYSQKIKRHEELTVASKLTDLNLIISTLKRIPHKEILRTSHSITNLPLSLVDIYRQKVLPQKTRTMRLLGRKCSAEIVNTLLGYEVIASHKRINCPDLVTARYIKIFTELGCHSIKLPYDPTITALLIPDLESGVQGIAEAIRRLFPRDLRLQQYVTREIYRIVRRQIRAAQKSYNASIQIRESLEE
jgi:hypothetical protein